MLASPSLDPRELRHRRRQNPRHRMPALGDPRRVAIQHLLRNTGDRQPAQMAIGFGDVSKPLIVPGMKQQGSGALGQAGEIAIAENPGGGIGRRIPGDRLAGKPRLQRRFKQRHVIRLHTKRRPLAHPIRQRADHPQHSDLRAAQRQVMADEAGGERGDGNRGHRHM